jgi:hypothetical protein
MRYWVSEVAGTGRWDSSNVEDEGLEAVMHGGTRFPHMGGGLGFMMRGPIQRHCGVYLGDLWK